MSVLTFPDAETLADLGTYAVRARSVDADGGIRLQADGRTLAAYVGVLPGSGLVGAGTVIGLRTMQLAEAVTLDVTVPLAAVSDRIARGVSEPGSPASLTLPPTTTSAAWAAMAPPRSGWEPIGSLTADEVSAIARQGIQQIAEGTPAAAGSHAVTALRQRVWGTSTSTTPAFPGGGAFAAYVLGFAPRGSEVRVFAQGRWSRLSTAVGHVLIR